MMTLLAIRILLRCRLSNRSEAPRSRRIVRTKQRLRQKNRVVWRPPCLKLRKHTENDRIDAIIGTESDIVNESKKLVSPTEEPSKKQRWVCVRYNQTNAKREQLKYHRWKVNYWLDERRLVPQRFDWSWTEITGVPHLSKATSCLNFDYWRLTTEGGAVIAPRTYLSGGALSTNHRISSETTHGRQNAKAIFLAAHGEWRL